MKFPAIAALLLTLSVSPTSATTARPLSEYCPTSIRPSSSPLIPLIEYNGLSTSSTTLQYCVTTSSYQEPTEDRILTRVAYSIGSELICSGNGGVWTTRDEFLDDSLTGGLSTEEKYFCDTASFVHPEGKHHRTYLAYVEEVGDGKGLNVDRLHYTLSNSGVDLAHKVAHLTEEKSMYILALTVSEVAEMTADLENLNIKYLQPLIPSLKIDPSFNTDYGDASTNSIRFSIPKNVNATTFRNRMEIMVKEAVGEDVCDFDSGECHISVTHDAFKTPALGNRFKIGGLKKQCTTKLF